MGSEFREFLDFVRDRTGRYPEKLADSFRDIFIYIPSGKTPPYTNYPSAIPRRKISIKRFFSNRNKDFRRLVYNEGWNDLEDLLGSELLRFCLTECIFAKRTKAGSFMVSSLLNLRNKITVNPPQKLNRIFFKTARYRVPDSSKVIRRKRRGRSSAKNPPKNLDHLFSPDQIEFSTDDMLSKIQHRSRKSQRGYLRIGNNTRMTMSSQVFNTRVGYFEIVEYEDCVEELEQILGQFKISDYNYDYKTAFEIAETEEAENLQCSGKLGNELPVSVMKSYIGIICRTVIPEQLLGSQENTSVLIEILDELLEAYRHQYTSLKPYIQMMRISDISWLKGVKNIDVQWCILGKLLKWIIKEFVLEIVRAEFHIATPNSCEKLYFRREHWRKLTNDFRRKMCEEKVIVSTDGLDTNVAHDGRWILLPKENGMKPIMAPINKPGKVTQAALRYLQQLYTTKYGETRKEVFLEKWRDLVQEFWNNRHKTRYLVCCSVKNAYESVDQRKLMKIVESLADSTGPKLRLRSYKTAKNLEAVKTGCFELKKCFSYPELEPPIASKSIFAYRPGKTVGISKKVLLQEIRRNILNQNIKMSSGRYLLRKGIAQGAVMSSVLCDMYYAHMEETHLSQIKDEGVLHRHEGNFLFATTHKASAARFLRLVNKGFPEYNCSFDADNTKTNLPGCPVIKTYITYLGFKINPGNLEMIADYSSGQPYAMAQPKPQCQLMQTFSSRLSDLVSLELDGVLDFQINSESTIINNLNCVFLAQAVRCLWLVRLLFDDILCHVKKICDIIKTTNLQIFERLQTNFHANGYDFEKLAPRFAVIPWKSYQRAFGRIPPIHVHFRSFFRENIKISEAAARRANYWF